jgi:hypothetical protein
VCQPDRHVSNFINPTFEDSTEAGRFVAEELAGAGRIAGRRAEFLVELDRHLAVSGGRLAAARAAAALLPLFGPIASSRWLPEPGFVAAIARNPRQIDKMNAAITEVEAELTHFTRTLGRFEGVRARPIGEALFCIDPVVP